MKATFHNTFLIARYQSSSGQNNSKQNYIAKKEVVLQKHLKDQLVLLIREDAFSVFKLKPTLITIKKKKKNCKGKMQGVRSDSNF